VLLVAAALLLTTGGCDIEPRCPGETMPAAVEVEVLPTNVVSDEGCNGLGASLDGEPIIYTTGKAANRGEPHNCPVETLATPDVQELYGVRIDFCFTRALGFTAKATWYAAPSKAPASMSTCCWTPCRRAARQPTHTASIFLLTSTVTARE
jgi:hypothetical protein